ncbi:MAG: hypothetical protein ABI227_00145 [Rhodanobacter sp.]
MKIFAAMSAMTVVVFFAALPVAHAESTPMHYCSKPVKPYKFTSEWEVQSFKNDVETYKRCIEDFVDEQNSAIEKHRAAASDAIDDWNSFVKYDLT